MRRSRSSPRSLRTSRKALMPLPTPYQPESMCRFWVHANTQGMARRSAKRSRLRAACRARADVEHRELLQGTRCLQILEHRRHFHQLSVSRPGRARQRLHGFMELVHRNQRRIALRSQHVLHHRCPEKLDLISRGAAIGVLEGDDLALLGDAELAADRPGRRGRDRATRGCAPAAHGTAPAVKESDGHAELAAEAREGALRLRELPMGGEVSAVLVGIRVSDHDFLDLCPARRGCAAPAARPATP